MQVAVAEAHSAAMAEGSALVQSSHVCTQLGQLMAQLSEATPHPNLLIRCHKGCLPSDVTRGDIRNASGSLQSLMPSQYEHAPTVH